MDLTFKQFLRILDEDLEGDIAKIQADIATVNVAITQKTAPLMAQKQRLEKLLFQKRKQQQAELKKGEREPEQGQQMAAGSQVTTPGTAGAATPGQG